VIGGENLYQIKCKKGVFQGQLENIFRWIDDISFHHWNSQKLADQRTFTLRCCDERED
jgi:hypothetical protein